MPPSKIRVFDQFSINGMKALYAICY